MLGSQTSAAAACRRAGGCRRVACTLFTGLESTPLPLRLLAKKFCAFLKRCYKPGSEATRSGLPSIGGDRSRKPLIVLPRLLTSAQLATESQGIRQSSRRCHSRPGLLSILVVVGFVVSRCRHGVFLGICFRQQSVSSVCFCGPLGHLMLAKAIDRHPTVHPPQLETESSTVFRCPLQ